jgi:para-nitrobenzyl esterase
MRVAGPQRENLRRIGSGCFRTFNRLFKGGSSLARSVNVFSRGMGQSILMKTIVAAVVLASAACASNPTDNSHPDNGPNLGSAGSAGSAAPACPVAPSTDPLVVATDKGLVHGKQAGNGLAFLGIPFAKPPMGSLRFMPPEPTECWAGEVDATNYGDTCAQFIGVPIGSEDCLNLNVWVPAGASSTSNLPVLVWMFGGGNFVGGTDFGLSELNLGPSVYDGQTLADNQNAIVVSFNYRVGVLGFLAHPALTAASGQHTSGNNGLLDAIQALHWVQDNIAAFGGDKTHVMLFGQSAGAFNTCSLVASPLAKGLFSSALMESGNCAAESLSYNYNFGINVADAVGCSNAADVVACLQSAPLQPMVAIGNIGYVAAYASKLLSPIDPKHASTLPFGPTVDGYVLDDVPLATIQAGNHNHMPLVIGTNASEFNFVADPLAVVGCVGAEALEHAWFPSLANQLGAAYPCQFLNPLSGAHSLGQEITDAIFTCPSRRAARAAVANQTEPVFRYLWTHVTPYAGGVLALGGTFHASEIPYVFGNFGAVLYSPMPAESVLSQQMGGYWANFAATGNPNGTGLPTWNQFDPTADNLLQLDTPVANISGFEGAGCDFWDSAE